MNQRLLVVGLVVLAGCNRYGRRVPDQIVTKLPYEVRIELLEAENELAAAIDKVDEAQNEVSRTRNSIIRAKDRENAAWREVGEAQDERSREVAELAVQESRARVEYLRALQEVNVTNHWLEEMSLQCSQARFELSRLQAARKAKVAGSEVLRPEDFEDQIKACEADLKDKRTAQAEQKKRFEEARTSWEERKTALAKKTFDARASPYVE
jgi:hypothetical protein